MNPLEIQDLSKSYGNLKAVNGVSLEVHPGEIFGLLGPNGAGKSSIISIVVTLENPTEGRVLVFGMDVAKQPTEAKMQVGWVPQEIINHGYFDIREILEFQSGYYGRRANHERIDFLLHRLSLWEHQHKKVKQLSGGMKRRLLIAKALVHSPKLLLLDEPTAGVDIELRAQLWDFVRELKKEGVSILLTTHYLEEAEALCDRVAILDRGRIRQMGPTADLIAKLTFRHIHICLKEPIFDGANHPYLVGQKGQWLEFRIPAAMEAGAFLADLGISLASISDMRIEEGTLEEAFKSVVEVSE